MTYILCRNSAPASSNSSATSNTQTNTSQKHAYVSLRLIFNLSDFLCFASLAYDLRLCYDSFTVTLQIKTQLFYSQLQKHSDRISNSHLKQFQIQIHFHLQTYEFDFEITKPTRKNRQHACRPHDNSRGLNCTGTGSGLSGLGHSHGKPQPD